MKTLREEDVLRVLRRNLPSIGPGDKAWWDKAPLLDAIAALPDASPQGPGSEGRPTITVSGPIACGKSAVMEIIYRALRDAGLHPFSNQLAHERRMVDEQPLPSETAWELIESTRLLRAPQQQAEPVVTVREAFNVMAKRRANELFTGVVNSYTSDFYFSIFSEGFYAGQRAAPPPDSEAVALLRELNPYLDRLVCYASTTDEHEPNRIVVEVRKLLSRKDQR